MTEESACGSPSGDVWGAAGAWVEGVRWLQRGAQREQCCVKKTPAFAR